MCLLNALCEYAAFDLIIPDFVCVVNHPQHSSNTHCSGMCGRCSAGTGVTGTAVLLQVFNTLVSLLGFDSIHKSKISTEQCYHGQKVTTEALDDSSHTDMLKLSIYINKY